MTISARSATSADEAAGLAPSPASASIAPRERLNTWTVWPAASSRCVIGRPILPRPTNPTCTGVWYLPRNRDSPGPAACLIDLAGERVAHGIDDEVGGIEHAIHADAVLDAQAI